MGVELMNHKPTSFAKYHESIILVWHYELSKEYVQSLIRSLTVDFKLSLKLQVDQQNIRLYFMMVKHFHVTFLYFEQKECYKEILYLLFRHPLGNEDALHIVLVTVLAMYFHK